MEKGNYTSMIYFSKRYLYIQLQMYGRNNRLVQNNWIITVVNDINLMNCYYIYTGKNYSFFSDKLLIELVKSKPGLYDLQSPYYSDNYYKKRMWDEIEQIVELMIRLLKYYIKYKILILYLYSNFYSALIFFCQGTLNRLED